MCLSNAFLEIKCLIVAFMKRAITFIKGNSQSKSMPQEILPIINMSFSKISPWSSTSSATFEKEKIENKIEF